MHRCLPIFYWGREFSLKNMYINKTGSLFVLNFSYNTVKFENATTISVNSFVSPYGNQNLCQNVTNIKMANNIVANYNL